MMRDLKISLCKHPTTVVLIDDSADYLGDLKMMCTGAMPYQGFTQPKLALEYLNQPQQPFIQRCMCVPEDEDSNHFISHVYLRKIQEEVKRSERHHEVSVVVVDYDMPGMDGITLCEQINNSNLLFLLLTARENTDVAITAFNKGIIHKFISKAAFNHDFDKLLLDEIRQLQQRYFSNLSNIVLSHASPNILKSLEDPVIYKLFKEICTHHSIVEHYIMSDSGDFLLVDAQGRHSRLSIMSQDDILKLFEFAAINKVSSRLLTALERKTHLPLFWDAYALENTPPEAWEPHLYPAHPVPDSDSYYYIYSKEPIAIHACLPLQVCT